VESARQLFAVRMAALDAEETVLHELDDRAAVATRRFDEVVQFARSTDDACVTARREEQRQRQSLLDTAAATVKARTELDHLQAAQQVQRQALGPAMHGIERWHEAVQRRGADLVVDLRAAHRLRQQVETASLAAGKAVQRHEAAAATAQRTGEELAEAVRNLEQALAAAGVAQRDVTEAAQLGAAAITAEGESLLGLHKQVDHHRAVLQERVEQRKSHEQHDRPELDEADAKDALDQARRSGEEVGKQKAEVQARLLADDAVRRLREQLAPALAKAERDLEVWAALDDLIGSSGGDAFVVFAQGLTLDLLLTEANRRLHEIARRYRLQRNHGGEMDFVVVDLDLGGSPRSLQTLSGGETFLVSLSLALALATLAAPRSRVETLFLDEGFGTLDAQHLEQALGALDTLQAAGCQVGVISHVEGIAERIGACVDVEPQGGGQSRVRARAR